MRTEGARDTLGASRTGSVARRRACARVRRRAVTGGAVTVTVTPATEESKGKFFVRRSIRSVRLHKSLEILLPG